jgi:hypothetical protein
MIKANELRFGNFVSDIHASESFYAEVNKLTPTRCYYGNFHSAYSHLKPIDLTEEWLLDFGFIDHGSYFNLSKRELFGHHFGDFAVSKYDDTQMKVRRGDRYIGVYCLKYVHHLQNLHFALTGTELMLKIIKFEN